ncbi:MAG: hypothetical protein ABEH81_08475 [Halopenitus sp.]
METTFRDEKEMFAAKTRSRDLGYRRPVDDGEPAV